MSRWRSYVTVVGLVMLFVAIGAVLRVQAVHAEPLAVVDGEPVTVRAQRLEVDLSKGLAVLQGEVELRRGELTVRCERVEARYDGAPNITWAKATGTVRAELRGMQARADEAELRMNDHTLHLRGGVRLWQAGAWLEAREASVDLRTRKLSLQEVKGSIPVPAAAAGSAR